MFESFLIISARLQAYNMIVFHAALLSCAIWSNSHYIPNSPEIVNLCARELPHATSKPNPGDGGFKITVDDNSDLRHYAPEHPYRISITGTSLEHMLSGAYLVAVSFNSSNENNTVGQFHLIDGGQLAFHVACSHIVTTVDSLPKAEVYVMWTSPMRGTGCVEFRYVGPYYR